MSAPKPIRSFKGVWIDKEIWDDRTLSWIEKCLLAEIDCLDDGNGCWAENKFLAEKMDSTPGSIAVQISKLRTNFWLVDLTEKDSIAGQTERRLKVVKSPVLRAKMIEWRERNSLMAVNDSLTAINDSLMTVKEFFASHIKEESTIEYKRVARTKSAHPDRLTFTDAWNEAYQAHFQRPYAFNGGRDAKAAEELLNLPGNTWQSIMEIARKAWSKAVSREYFHSNRAVTIHGLRNSWNEIRAEIEPRQRKIDYSKGF